MIRFLALLILVVTGVTAWHIGSSLSTDAIAMGIGVIFGVMAGIPTALLLTIQQRNQRHNAQPDTPPPAQPTPPVIVLTAGAGHRTGAAIPADRWIDGPVTVDANRPWHEVEDW